MSRPENVSALNEEEAAAALTRLGEDATVDQIKQAGEGIGRVLSSVADAKAGLHYSEMILGELVRSHGWERTNSPTRLEKNFSAKEGGTGPTNERAFFAHFSDPRQRYLQFEGPWIEAFDYVRFSDPNELSMSFRSGWAEPFDIDCRDRDVAGVAAEFDLRATRWAVRDIAIPTLPAYAQTALDQLKRESSHRTAEKLDEFLDAAARAAGAEVDIETRLNVRHRAALDIDEAPYFQDKPHWPLAEIVVRDERGNAREVAYEGKRYSAIDLVRDFAMEKALEIDPVALEAALIGFGVLPGRAFDLAHSPNRNPVAVAEVLSEALDIDLPRSAEQKVEPHVARDWRGVGAKFVATTADEKKTMDFAVANYGYLVSRNDAISLAEFADRIAECYDASVPQTAEVVRVLRQCATYPLTGLHEQGPRVAVPLHDRPLAAEGLTSYRCKGPFGWIMIGANDDDGAFKEALRSSERADRATLQRWNGVEYADVAPTPRADDALSFDM